MILYICALNRLLSSVVEQLTRNEQVEGSTPLGGSNYCGLGISDFGFFGIFDKIIGFL